MPVFSLAWLISLDKNKQNFFSMCLGLHFTLIFAILIMQVHCH